MAEKGEVCGGCGYRFTTKEQAYRAPQYLKAPNVACGCDHTPIGNWERAKHAAGLHHYRGWRAGDTPNRQPAHVIAAVEKAEAPAEDMPF